MDWHLMAWTYAVMSVVTFGAYGYDKVRARRASRRIPQWQLHLLELLCGWPGGLAGQVILRHKIRKPSYLLVFWLIVALHAAIWIWWLR